MRRGPLGLLSLDQELAGCMAQGPQQVFGRQRVYVQGQKRQASNKEPLRMRPVGDYGCERHSVRIEDLIYLLFVAQC